MNALFFFNDPATSEISTLSLHDALPIPIPSPPGAFNPPDPAGTNSPRKLGLEQLRSSTLLILLLPTCTSDETRNRRELGAFSPPMPWGTNVSRNAPVLSKRSTLLLPRLS